MKWLVVAMNSALAAALALSCRAVAIEILVPVFWATQLILFLSHYMVLVHEGQPDLLDGLNVLHLGFFFHFTVPPMLILSGAMPTVYGYLWSSDDIPYALAAIQAMCVAIQFGYYCRPVLLPRTPFVGQVASPFRLAVFLAAVMLVAASVGMLSFFDLVTILPTSVVRSGPVIAFSSLSLYLPYFLLILLNDQKGLFTQSLVVAGLALSASISLFYGIGSKAGVGNLIVAYFLSRHYFRKRMSLAQAVSVALFGGLVISYMNYTRAVGMISGLTRDTANPFSAENSATFMWAGVASTLTPFEAFLVVLRTFPDVLPYQMGQRLFEDMVYPLLPRAMFPWKPEIYGGAFFWDYHLGFLSLENKIYEAISLPGHFYLDYGMYGVLAGGVIVGAAQRFLYEWLARGGRSRGAVCLYGMLTALSIISARAFTWTTYTVFASLLFPLIILKMLHVPETLAPTRV